MSDSILDNLDSIRTFTNNLMLAYKKENPWLVEIHAKEVLSVVEKIEKKIRGGD